MIWDEDEGKGNARWLADLDLEVSDTCIRNSLLRSLDV